VIVLVSTWIIAPVTWAARKTLPLLEHDAEPEAEGLRPQAYARAEAGVAFS
jgi:hypothetical protein